MSLCTPGFIHFALPCSNGSAFFVSCAACMMSAFSCSGAGRRWKMSEAYACLFRISVTWLGFGAQIRARIRVRVGVRVGVTSTGFFSIISRHRSLGDFISSLPSPNAARMLSRSSWNRVK